MTKQELAAKIWGSTNELRGSIELGTYKDYMLSLLFYKFISDKERSYLFEQGWTEEDLPQMTEEDIETMVDCQRNIGYFISYDNLFSTWISLEHDFTVKNVTDALNAFNRLIGESHKRVYNDIFKTLQSSISKLGTTAAEQTKALRNLIEVINEIPVDKAQDYDVLGFIYEYLIGNFAANAGKKAGEFYTPHEVSTVMSEIVCHHLQGRETIKVLDPTSGSGSLLITIGKAFAKYSGGENNVDYYAQEWIESTYNLTRMNLIMKGILPNNIHVRNGDTLDKENDWPFFDESDPENTYFPLPADAVVSNPPYSQKWNSSDREGDPRFSYGIAPKGKADFAFLLYDLYHIRPDGIATVILPHGVLFRGNEEGKIRRNLIENNLIDTIIGFPANMFFGTGIPTILMVLKKKREDTSVLFVDASKGFVKNGNKNKLQAKNIKKIVDVVINRINVEGYARLVSKEEIAANDYNLNIPRYVDSSEPEKNWDINALMFGGIPEREIDDYSDFWKAFPSLRNELFVNIKPGYMRLKTDDVKNGILNNFDVKGYIDQHDLAFNDLDGYLFSRWLENPEKINIATEENEVSRELFHRYKGMPLVDPYLAYQILDNQYAVFSSDIELIKNEGFINAVRTVDPNMVTKKKDNKTIEVQEGWKGHVLPFEIVQKLYFAYALEQMNLMNDRLQEIESEVEEIYNSISQDDLDEEITNEDDSGFDGKGVAAKCKEIIDEINTPEIDALRKYINLLDKKTSKQDLVTYIQSCNLVSWDQMEVSKNGTYGKTTVNNYIARLKQQFTFDSDSTEAKFLKVNALFLEEKDIKKSIKELSKELEQKTKEKIENISEDEAKDILKNKWVLPLTEQISQMPHMVIGDFVKHIINLSNKYEINMTGLEPQIKEEEKALGEMLKELVGSETDMEGLRTFGRILGVD